MFNQHTIYKYLLIVPNVTQETPLAPLATRVNPKMAPIILWVPETGSLNAVAMTCHTAEPEKKKTKEKENIHLTIAMFTSLILTFAYK